MNCEGSRLSLCSSKQGASWLRRRYIGRRLSLIKSPPKMSRSKDSSRKPALESITTWFISLNRWPHLLSSEAVRWEVDVGGSLRCLFRNHLRCTSAQRLSQRVSRREARRSASEIRGELMRKTCASILLSSCRYSPRSDATIPHIPATIPSTRSVPSGRGSRSDTVAEYGCS